MNSSGFARISARWRSVRDPMLDTVGSSDPRYAKLLRRLERSVAIEHQVIQIAGRPYPWTRVVDPDRLLEMALTSGLDGSVEHDPFWAATWRAAIGLERFLCQQETLSGQRVLELGGGSGRAGIAAAILGAQVCITDASRKALMICRYNARSVARQVRVRLLDWARPETLSQRFPIILGSDIVYNPSLYPILEPCLRRLLADGGVVWLSEPHRHTGDRFETWIRAAGWKCRSSCVDLDDGERSIRIFECRLP
jgi:SAM-dependent methyltransferase